MIRELYKKVTDLDRNDVLAKIFKKQNFKRENTDRNLFEKKITNKSDVKQNLKRESSIGTSIIRIMGYNASIDPIQHEIYPQISEKHPTVSEMKKFSQIYLQFSKNINLSTIGHPVRKFDFVIFRDIFSSTYKDSIIERFLNVLLQYGMECGKEDKLKYIQLLKMALYYTENLKMYVITKELKSKISRIPENHITNSVEYFYKATGVYLIDEMYLKDAIMGCKKSEAEFLNFIYRQYIRGKPLKTQLVHTFLQRLLKNINVIEPKYLLYFLRLIFTASSVFFSNLNNTEIMKLFLEFCHGFINKLALINITICEIYKSLIEKLHSDMSILSILFELSNALENIKTKNNNTFALIQIWKSKSFSQIIEIFKLYKDTFLITQSLLNETTNILSEFMITAFTLDQSEIPIIFVIDLWNSLKVEYKCRLYKSILTMFILVFQNLNKKINLKKIEFLHDSEYKRLIDVYNKIQPLTYIKISSFILFVQNNEDAIVKHNKKKNKLKESRINFENTGIMKLKKIINKNEEFFGKVFTLLSLPKKPLLKSRSCSLKER